MISRLLLPSCVRLATYSCVRVSRHIRDRQIMYRARLASRLPPRLRRCLTTLPEEASRGSGRFEASPTAILQDTHSVEGEFSGIRGLSPHSVFASMPGREAGPRLLEGEIKASG